MSSLLPQRILSLLSLVLFTLFSLLSKAEEMSPEHFNHLDKGAVKPLMGAAYLPIGFECYARIAPYAEYKRLKSPSTKETETYQATFYHIPDNGLLTRVTGEKGSVLITEISHYDIFKKTYQRWRKLSHDDRYHIFDGATSEGLGIDGEIHWLQTAPKEHRGRIEVESVSNSKVYRRTLYAKRNHKPTLWIETDVMKGSERNLEVNSKARSTLSSVDPRESALGTSSLRDGLDSQLGDAAFKQKKLEDFMAQIEKNSRENKGKKPKEGLFSRLFGNKSAAQNPPEPKEPLVFKDFNFSLDHPGEGWAEFDKSLINANATVIMRQARTNTFLLIIAEPLVEISQDHLTKISAANLKGALQDVEQTKEESVIADGAIFDLNSYLGKAQSREFTYVAGTAMVRGQAFQVLCWHQKKVRNKEASVQILSDILKGFRILDKSKGIDIEVDGVTPFRNNASGLTFTPVQGKTQNWDLASLQEQFPNASYGVLRPGGAGIFLQEIELDGLTCSDEALAYSLCKLAGFDFETEILRKREFQQGSAKGFEYDAEFKSEGNLFKYRFRILRNGSNHALCITGYTPDQSKSAMADLGEVMDLFSIKDPMPNPQASDYPASYVNSSASLNQIGLYYYNSGNYGKAGEFFSKAAEHDPDYLTYQMNVARSMNAAGEAANALSYLEGRSDALQEDISALILKAEIFNALERRKESIESYRKAFEEKAHQDEDDLLAYLNVLDAEGQSQEAVAALDRYLSKGYENSLRVKRWHAQLTSSAGHFDQAVTLFEALHKEAPSNVQLQEDLISAYINAEEGEKALGYIEKRLKAEPLNPYLYLYKGQAYQLSKEWEKAKLALEKAKELAPTDATIADALSVTLAYLGQGDQTSANTPIVAVSVPSELSDWMDSQILDQQKENTNIIYLKSSTGFQYQKGEVLKQTERRSVQVLNKAGIESMKTVTFNFDPTYERAYLNELVVKDNEGNELAKVVRSDCYVRSTSKQSEGLATSEVTFCAPVAGLQVGAIVEYTYTTESKASYDEFPFESWLMLSGSLGGPKAYYVYSDDASIEHKVFGEPDVKEFSGDEFKAWAVKRLERYVWEPEAPSYYKVYPWLVIGEKTDGWEKLGLEYLESIQSQLELSEKVKSLAQDLVNSEMTASVKAKALAAYVQKDLVYQGIEFGRRARIPNEVNQIIDNGYGDCKDHSIFLYQLLNSVGIEAHLALIDSSRPVVESLPSLDQFDHMIVYTPEIRGGMFWDMTSKIHDLDVSCPISLQGQRALVLSPESPHLVLLESDDDFSHYLHSQRKVRISDDGMDLSIQEKIEMTGRYAGYMRSYFKNLDEANRKLTLEQQMNSGFLMKVTDLKIEGLTQNEGPLLFTMDYTMKQAGEQAGELIQITLPSIWEKTYLNAGGTLNRKGPFEVVFDFTFKSDVEIELGTSWEIKKNSWTSALTENEKIVSARVKDRSLTKISVESQIKKGIYQAVDWADYVTRLRTIRRQVAPTLSIEKKR